MIRTYGFIKNREEPCIYKWANSSIVIFFVLYVDGILLIENDISVLQSIKAMAIITVLHEEFGRSILHPRDENL